jgi:hypothetical protein
MLTANTTQMTNCEDDFIVLDDEDFIEVSGGNIAPPPGDDGRGGGTASAGSRIPAKLAS